MRLTFDPRLLRVTKDNRLQELIGLVLLILLFNSLDNIVGLLSLTLHQTINGDLDALPSLVSVHSVVPPNDRRDLSVFFLGDEIQQILNVACGRAGGSVTSVTEEVDVNVRDANFLGCLKKSVKVGYM